MPYLSKVRAGLPSSHPMQNYLIQSQLIVFKNLNDTCGKLPASRLDDCQKSLKNEKCVAQKAINDLHNLLEKDLPEVVAQWKSQTGLLPGSNCQETDTSTTN